MNKKQKALIDLESVIDDGISLGSHGLQVKVLGMALEESARGTAHYYEALRLLSLILPEEYKEAFERLKEE